MKNSRRTLRQNFYLYEKYEKAEERCQQASEAHHREVFERKRMQEKLENARAVAVKASQAKSDFLTKMSHEIRTPMNGILGMAELMRDTPLNEEQKDYIHTVQHSAQNLLGILDDILDFSRVGSGKLTPTKREFSLRNLLAEIVPMFATQAQHKEIFLSYFIDPKIPEYLQGDSQLLKRVLVKLLGNAVKYTERGRVEIGVQQRAFSGKKIALLFYVSDTGIGIPKEKQRIIFNAFSQGDDSHSRSFGGTGLGLAIASQLVAMLGGNIIVESEVGKGSRFDFILSFELSSPVPLSSAAEKKGMGGAKADSSSRVNRQAL